MINILRLTLTQSLHLGVIIVGLLAGSVCQGNVGGSEAPIQPHFFQWQTEVIPLVGTWDFALDPEHIGIKEQWYSAKLADSVILPGTTDENRKGQFIVERIDDRLSRVWFWKDAVWYQGEVEITTEWIGKRIQLLLEGKKDTHVWVNDTYVGYENTLIGPHYFDLTAAAQAGSNRIALLVDNPVLPPVGLAHAIDETTQTDYWSYPMFLRPAIKRGKDPAPGSLGFMCFPDSPLFAKFPTQFRRNWQWWHLEVTC